MKKLTAIVLSFAAISTSAADIEKSEESQFYLDYFNFEDEVYSRSKKTQLGDEVEMELAVKYLYQKGTYARFRFQTYPEDNREGNKTDKFEISIGHTYQNFEGSIDLELLTNDGTKGGNAIGPDLDSEYTFLKWKINNYFNLTFYPFNFDGEVGEEFDTWDVTRIYSIEGSPTSISGTAPTGASISEKTIPGLGFSFSPAKNLSLSTAIGVATYLSPTNPNFDLKTVPTASSWERKEDLGYKLGLNYKNTFFRSKIEWVSHNKSAETGALLQSAGNAYAIVRQGIFILEGEFAYSKAGLNPWDVSRETDWFENISTNPYFDTTGGEDQDWFGKSDIATSWKIGLDLGDWSPYLSLKYQGEHFVYNDDESAHNLRTADDSLSHGGLTRAGIGSYLKYGKFVVNPEFEVRRSKNPVFSSAGDVAADRVTASFRKNDYLIQLFLTYNFDGKPVFSP